MHSYKFMHTCISASNSGMYIHVYMCETACVHVRGCYLIRIGAHQEVKYAESQHIKREADVAVVVKPVQHLNTHTVCACVCVCVGVWVGG